ncbi:MAG TPA: hypothetical protein VMS08_03495 [Candidatus Saccharimonadia bacterium]|jgi:predicted GNAT family acetyltransferase|nr:hypothetical protein [Candidatus Saccharimonadia bacterium]
MTTEVLLELITALVQAIPELLALFGKSTGQINPTDVQTIIQKYGADQAIFTAAIAAAKAKGL